MLLARLVVEQRLLLHRVAHRGLGHPGTRIGGRDLEHVERGARVAVGEPRDEGQRVGLGGGAAGQAALGIGERALQDGHEVGLAERAQHVDAAAREQRAVDLERGVLGGGADQHDGALLDVGEEGVLLRPVEAVDLVHEEDRPLSAAATLGFRLGHHLADLLDARHHRRERHEAGARHVGQEARQRGLAGAGRPPEDHRVELALLEGTAQRLAGLGELRLADDLVEARRAHAVGQRGGRLRGGGRRRVEEIHAANYTHPLPSGERAG